MEEAGGVEIRQQGELAGGQPWVISRTRQRDDTDDPMDKEATKALRSTSTVSDCVGYVPSSLLDARQRQPSTESYGANIQTGLILGSTKTMYRY
jgi:hypothetical protein